MSVLTQKLHLLRQGGSEDTALIYTSASECPEPNLKVEVNGTQCYVKLGDINDYYATSGRVHRNIDNRDYAILSRHKVSDFPNAWGEFVRIDFTCSLQGEVSNWLYVFSMHFTNGVIPLIVYRDGTILRDDNLFEYNASSDFNSGYYYNGAWINVTAKNGSGKVSWVNAAGVTYRSVSNTSLQMEGFNDNRNTVFADATFSATLSNDVLSIYKYGTLFVQYNV